ncbi:MAG: hypothetical protein IJ783_01255 [Kiritimatiellae bacterium]|nr:hypothetical protein [Kiritimatiellia bacterium]
MNGQKLEIPLLDPDECNLGEYGIPVFARDGHATARKRGLTDYANSRCAETLVSERPFGR